MVFQRNFQPPSSEINKPSLRKEVVGSFEMLKTHLADYVASDPTR